MMPLDPSADIGRRAWLDCPECDQHWQYLLGNRARLVFLQCPECGHLWEHNQVA